MLHQTKGIVLKQIKYGDSGLIVQIYTLKFGRQAYMVKGGRSKKSKTKSNLFRTFALLDMEVYHKDGKEIQSIKEARFCEDLTQTLLDIHKSTMVLFLGEVCAKVLQEEETNRELFVFLYNSIRYLNLTDEQIDNFHLYFLSKLTRFLGCYPMLNWSEENAYFDLDNGSFVRLSKKHAHCLEKAESKVFYSLFLTSIDAYNDLQINSKNRKQILRSLLNFYALQLNGFTSLKSLQVIEEIFD